ncbi:MAG TPA: ABC transporter substrate-binding protein [Candidatus Limnocylindrales bacterium]|nr:ABC transporter substrate-binding protein [Candidatus Limnocylindrales bacterium]
MNFYDHSRTLLADFPYGPARSLHERKAAIVSVRRLGWRFFIKHLVLSLTLLLLSSADVFAQPIKFAYAALNAGQVAPWIAKEAGYLSKYGIEADLIYIPAVAATQALIAGEIQLAQVTGVSTAGAILAGADVRIIASVQNKLAGTIYARPEITSPEQLKGKKLGISRFGALSDTAVSIFLQRYGLKRNTDVAVVQMGGLPEIITALERGAIQAGFANPPQTSRAKKLGMRQLFDLNTLGVDLQQTCVTVTTKYMRERRPVVKGFLQAYAEGLHRFITDRDFSIQVMKKYLRIDDKDILDDAYTFYSEKLEKIPYPTLKGIKFIIDEMAERNPQAKKASPESFVDLSVLQEIEQSGFFTQLWKN